MAESQELPNCGLKCRKCRSGFLAEIEHDGIKSTSDLYVFSDENMPQWISQKVEEVIAFFLSNHFKINRYVPAYYQYYCLLQFSNDFVHFKKSAVTFNSSF